MSSVLLGLVGLGDGRRSECDCSRPALKLRDLVILSLLAQGSSSTGRLADGRMVGVWRHERKGKRLDVTIDSLTKRRDGLIEQNIGSIRDKRLAAVNPTPEETVQTLKEDAQWLKEQRS